MEWGYTQQDVNRADGKEEIVVSEVAPLEGTPYERLVSKNGKPLSTEEKRKEDRKFQKERQRRREESPGERRARIEKYEKERAFIKEIPLAYNFALSGDEVIAGRPAWVVTLAPKPGFVPSTPRAELLRHIEGKLWIDKQDLQWAQAEAHVIDTIGIGFILARIAPGAHITLNMTRVNSSLWVTRDIEINGAARVFLVYTRNLDEEVTFSGYHRGPDAPNATPVAKR